jgi:hydrogenase maturation protease
MALRDVVVLGIGIADLGDGGVGAAVAERLRDLLPGGVRILTPGAIDSAFEAELEGATHVLVLDCVDVGREPGTIVLFDNEVLSPCIASVSFRDTAVAHLLVLAGQHADAPEEVALLGVQPSGEILQSEMSSVVADAVAQLTDEAMAVVAAWLDAGSSDPSATGRRTRPPEC